METNVLCFCYPYPMRSGSKSRRLVLGHAAGLLRPRLAGAAKRTQPSDNNIFTFCPDRRIILLPLGSRSAYKETTQQTSSEIWVNSAQRAVKLNNSTELNNTFYNFTFDKGRLKSLVSWSLKTYGEYKTIQLLENLKKTGFEYATKAGISLGIEDLKIPPKKAALLYEAETISKKAIDQYNRGEITGVERFQRLIDTWHRTSEHLKQEVIDYFEKTDILNPVYMMAFSGARGNISQVRQLVGMRGLMADPKGQIIDYPIRSNFREGLTVTEYIISSYGARKGIVDTALRTANAGYLTRRLVDVAQHVVISNFDCGTHKGIFLNDMKDGNKTIYSLQTRLLGRILGRDLSSPANGNLALRNQEITADLAFEITKYYKKVFVRSPLTCETPKLVCQLCYGWSLAQGNLVSIGEAVGIVAAQSIGEPGTQLTMRTFHTGGVFSGDISDLIRAPYDGFVHYTSLKDEIQPQTTASNNGNKTAQAGIAGILVRTIEGKMAFLTKTDGFICVYNSQHPIETAKKWKIPAYTILYYKQGGAVCAKQVVAQISTIARQQNMRDDSEFTLKSEMQGQFFIRTLQIEEQVIGPKLKTNSTGSELFNPLIMDPKQTSWDWGYAWILSCKLYNAPLLNPIVSTGLRELPSAQTASGLSATNRAQVDGTNDLNLFSKVALVPRVGDFVDQNSIMTQIQWYLPQHGGYLIYFQKLMLGLRGKNTENKLESGRNSKTGTHSAPANTPIARQTSLIHKPAKLLNNITLSKNLLCLDINEIYYQKIGYFLEKLGELDRKTLIFLPTNLKGLTNSTFQSSTHSQEYFAKRQNSQLFGIQVFDSAQKNLKKARGSFLDRSASGFYTKISRFSGLPYKKFSKTPKTFAQNSFARLLSNSNGLANGLSILGHAPQTVSAEQYRRAALFGQNSSDLPLNFDLQINSLFTRLLMGFTQASSGPLRVNRKTINNKQKAKTSKSVNKHVTTFGFLCRANTAINKSVKGRFFESGHIQIKPMFSQPVQRTTRNFKKNLLNNLGLRSAISNSAVSNSAVRLGRAALILSNSLVRKRLLEPKVCQYIFKNPMLKPETRSTSKKAGWASNVSRKASHGQGIRTEGHALTSLVSQFKKILTTGFDSQKQNSIGHLILPKSISTTKTSKSDKGNLATVFRKNADTARAKLSSKQQKPVKQVLFGKIWILPSKLKRGNAPHAVESQTTKAYQKLSKMQQTKLLAVNYPVSSDFVSLFTRKVMGFAPLCLKRLVKPINSKPEASKSKPIKQKLTDHANKSLLVCYGYKGYKKGYQKKTFKTLTALLKQKPNLFVFNLAKSGNTKNTTTPVLLGSDLKTVLTIPNSPGKTFSRCAGKIAWYAKPEGRKDKPTPLPKRVEAFAARTDNTHFYTANDSPAWVFKTFQPSGNKLKERNSKTNGVIASNDNLPLKKALEKSNCPLDFKKLKWYVNPKPRFLPLELDSKPNQTDLHPGQDNGTKPPSQNNKPNSKLFLFFATQKEQFAHKTDAAQGGTSKSNSAGRLNKKSGIAYFRSSKITNTHKNQNNSLKFLNPINKQTFLTQINSTELAISLRNGINQRSSSKDWLVIATQNKVLGLGHLLGGQTASKKAPKMSANPQSGVGHIYKRIFYKKANLVSSQTGLSGRPNSSAEGWGLAHGALNKQTISLNPLSKIPNATIVVLPTPTISERPTTPINLPKQNNGSKTFILTFSMPDLFHGSTSQKFKYCQINVMSQQNGPANIILQKNKPTMGETPLDFLQPILSKLTFNNTLWKLGIGNKKLNGPEVLDSSPLVFGLPVSQKLNVACAFLCLNPTKKLCRLANVAAPTGESEAKAEFLSMPRLKPWKTCHIKNSGQKRFTSKTMLLSLFKQVCFEMNLIIKFKDYKMKKHGRRNQNLASSFFVSNGEGPQSGGKNYSELRESLESKPDWFSNSESLHVAKLSENGGGSSLSIANCPAIWREPAIIQGFASQPDTMAAHSILGGGQNFQTTLKVCFDNINYALTSLASTSFLSSYTGEIISLGYNHDLNRYKAYAAGITSPSDANKVALKLKNATLYGPQTAAKALDTTRLFPSFITNAFLSKQPISYIQKQKILDQKPRCFILTRNDFFSYKLSQRSISSAPVTKLLLKNSKLSGSHSAKTQFEYCPRLSDLKKLNSLVFASKKASIFGHIGIKNGQADLNNTVCQSAPALSVQVGRQEKEPLSLVQNQIRIGSFAFRGTVAQPPGSALSEDVKVFNVPGQIIHLNNSKITIRKAQPFFVSARATFHSFHGEFVRSKEPVITLVYQKFKTGDIIQGIPKVEQFFEARTTKRGRLFRDNLPNLLKGLFLKYYFYYYRLLKQGFGNDYSNLDSKASILDYLYTNPTTNTSKPVGWPMDVSDKRSRPHVNKGFADLDYSVLASQWAVKQSFYKIQQIAVDGVLRVYRSQGVTISDKHLEVVVKQMTTKVRIIQSGQSSFFPGEIVDLDFVEALNTLLIRKVQYEPILLGITKASLQVDSFLSAASFQQTSKILSHAALVNKKDYLKGVKENVILGNLIPAGTGYLVSLDKV